MDMVCTEMPLGCKTTSTFLLDTSYFQSTLDIRADNNGKWRHNGRKSEFIGVDDDGHVNNLEEKPGTLTSGVYRLHRSYWAHSSNSEFKRRMTELEDHRVQSFQWYYCSTYTMESQKILKWSPTKMQKSLPHLPMEQQRAHEKKWQRGRRQLWTVIDLWWRWAYRQICLMYRSKRYFASQIWKRKASKAAQQRCTGRADREMQVSPGVRAVLATESQLQD